MPDKAAIIQHTQTWLSSIVIGHGLCPFAKREYDNARIDYVVIDTADRQSQLEQVLLQCAVLDKEKSLATALLIFPAALAEFPAYLDVLDMANDLLKTSGYDGVYQLASFHPQYCFAGMPVNDPSHYTNRSPYPMLHILREDSLTAALEDYPNPESIPARNIKWAQGLGLPAVKQLLAKCFDAPK